MLVVFGLFVRRRHSRSLDGSVAASWLGYLPLKEKGLCTSIFSVVELVLPTRCCNPNFKGVATPERVGKANKCLRP